MELQTTATSTNLHRTYKQARELVESTLWMCCCFLVGAFWHFHGLANVKSTSKHFMWSWSEARDKRQWSPVEFDGLIIDSTMTTRIWLNISWAIGSRASARLAWIFFGVLYLNLRCSRWFNRQKFEFHYFLFYKPNLSVAGSNKSRVLDSRFI